MRFNQNNMKSFYRFSSYRSQSFGFLIPFLFIQTLCFSQSPNHTKDFSIYFGVGVLSSDYFLEKKLEKQYGPVVREIIPNLQFSMGYSVLRRFEVNLTGGYRKRDVSFPEHHTNNEDYSFEAMSLSALGRIYFYDLRFRGVPRGQFYLIGGMVVDFFRFPVPGFFGEYFSHLTIVSPQFSIGLGLKLMLSDHFGFFSELASYPTLGEIGFLFRF